jgi:hypothetical protein
VSHTRAWAYHLIFEWLEREMEKRKRRELMIVMEMVFKLLPRRAFLGCTTTRISPLVTLLV